MPTRRFQSYTVYSVAAFVVWAVTLAGIAILAPPKLDTFALVAFGWAIGWLSATIARSVYPPPRRGAPSS